MPASSIVMGDAQRPTPSLLDVQFSDDEFSDALTTAQIQPEWAVVSFGDQLESEEWTA